MSDHRRDSLEEEVVAMEMGKSDGKLNRVAARAVANLFQHNTFLVDHPSLLLLREHCETASVLSILCRLLHVWAFFAKSQNITEYLSLLALTK